MRRHPELNFRTFFVVVVLPCTLYFCSQMAAVFQMESVTEYLKELDPGTGMALLTGVISASTVSVVVSTTPLNLAAGAMYGVFSGSLLMLVGCVFGSMINFIIGRYFARSWARSKMQQYPMLKALDRALERNSLYMITLARLSPVFPFAILGYALGPTSVSMRDYIIGTSMVFWPEHLLACSFLHVFLVQMHRVCTRGACCTLIWGVV